MVEVFEKLNKKADEIAKLMVADVVKDVDLLTVALCVCSMREVSFTIRHAQEGDIRYRAAHKSLDICWVPELREKLIAEGYFEKNFRGLLNLSMMNSDAGCRLMPVFNEAVVAYKKLGISKKFKRELERFMEDKKEKDGFAITAITDDGRVIIHAASWLTAE